VGKPNTFEFRVFLTDEKKRISAWHDVPLVVSPGVYNMVVEMPKGTDEKMEVALKEDLVAFGVVKGSCSLSLL
jgi:inorganic pyrophosphatase